jgi:hypothetical protein
MSFRSRLLFDAEQGYDRGMAISVELPDDGTHDVLPKPISECLEEVDSEVGRRRVRSCLQTLPFPHYEPAPDAPGMLIRIEADGTRTLGKFVNREFQARTE